jgi:hypothetical protein
MGRIEEKLDFRLSAPFFRLFSTWFFSFRLLQQCRETEKGGIGRRRKKNHHRFPRAIELETRNA